MRKIIYGLAAVGVPAAAIGLYMALGNPGVPDHPLEARYSNQTQALSQIQVEALVAGRVRNAPATEVDPEFLDLIEQLQDKIERTGGDAKGFELLGSAYVRTQNYVQAWRAFEEAARRSKEQRHTVLQLENMVAAADGYMSADSISLLEQVKAFDNFRIPYYQGVVAAQKGTLDQAAQIWTQTLQRDDVPPALAQTLAQQIRQAQQEIGLNTPTNEDIDYAATLTPEERIAMIDGMVSSLAQKLEDNPDDLMGWLQLIQAYAVLERKEEAEEALAKARSIFKEQPDALARLTVLDAQINP